MRDAAGRRRLPPWTATALLSAVALAAGSPAARAAVYVVDITAGELATIDPIRRATLGTIRIAGEPRDVAVSPDGSLVYAATGSVSILDVAANRRMEVRVEPLFAAALAVPASGTSVLVTGSCYGACEAESGGGLALLDAATGVVRTMVALPESGLAVAVRGDGGEAYVATCGDATCDPALGGRLHVVDLETRAMTTIPLRAQARALALSPDGRLLYAPVFDWKTSGPQDLVIVDVATRSVADTVRLPGSQSNALAVSPDGRRVYVADRALQSVYVFDTTKRRVVETIGLWAAGTWPPPDLCDMVLDPSGTRLWIIDANRQALLVVDVASGGVVGTVGLGPFPYAIAAGPTPPMADDATVADRRCAQRAARITTRSARHLVRCHARAARRALRGTPTDPDASTCRADAVAMVRDAVTSLPGCQPCTSDLPAGLAQVTDAAFDESTARMLYCHGDDALYDASAGVVPPDRRTLRVEEAAGQIFGRLAGGLVRCELERADVESCRARAVGRYDRALKRLAARVSCIARGGDGVRFVVQPAVRSIGEHLRCVESAAKP